MMNELLKEIYVLKFNKALTMQNSMLPSETIGMLTKWTSVLSHCVVLQARF